MKKEYLIFAVIPVFCMNVYSQIQFEAGDFTKYRAGIPVKPSQAFDTALLLIKC